MADTADRVIVELQAKLDRYNANIAGAERHFDRSMRNIQGSASRTEARVSSAFRTMAGAAGITIGTAGVVLAAREFLRYADTAKNLEAQLRLATRASGSFAQAQADVRRIAAETRSGLEETANLYATFQRNARELGISQEQAARSTETVTKAFQISGASAAEAAGGLRQFLQGIQSGTLRGEELNSVLENAPRLARLIADSLGVTIGQLRALGQAGNLAGAQLIEALTNRRFTEQIDAEFRELPVTFEQAMTLVNNAAIETFGAFDRGGRFSETIANFITQGTGGMEDIADAAEQTGINTRAAFDGLGDAFRPLWEGAIEAFGGINSEITNTKEQIAGLLSLIDAVRNVGPNIQNWAHDADMRIFGRSFYGRAPTSNLEGVFRAGFDRSQRSGQDDTLARRMGLQTRGGRSIASQEFQRYLNEPDRYDMLGRELNPSRRPPTAAGGRKRRGARGESAENRARREAREEQQFQNELAQLNEDLLAARQAMVTAADAVATYEVQQIEAARDRQNAAYQAAVAQARGDRDVAQARADQLVALNNQVAEERIRTVRLREERRLFEQREEVERERLDLAQGDLETSAELERLHSQLAETGDGQRASALRQLDLSMEMERIQLRAVIAASERLDALQQGTEDERRTAAAAAEIARRRLAALPTIGAGERELISRQFESPRDRYARELARPLGEQLEDLEVDSVRRLEDSFVSATKAALGLHGAIGDIVGELIRLALQQQLILPLLNAVGGGGKGGGGGTGSAVTAALGAIGATGGFGGFRAAGGPVQAGKAYVVGERRPELFVPDRPGMIVPQAKAIRPVGGHVTAARPQITVISAPQFDLTGAVMTPQLMREVDRVSREHAARAATAMGQGVMKAVPNRMAQYQSDGT